MCSTKTCTILIRQFRLDITSSHSTPFITTTNENNMSRPPLKSTSSSSSSPGLHQLTPSPSYTQKELLSLSHLLHLIHHHNKNQHRLSKWYKSLSTFRRQVSNLLVEVQELDTALAFSLSNKTRDGRIAGERKGKEGKYVRVAREKVEVRVRFWMEHCVERWFL